MKHYILLISAIISVGLSSYLSAIRPWGMQDQAMISENFSTIITPAGFIFSIWWLIYTSWILLWVYVAYKKIKIKKKSIYLLAAAQVLSTLWLIPSQYAQIALSFLVMLWILTLLYMWVTRKDKNKYFSWVVQLFFWWILVASIANLHQTLVYLDIYYYPVILWVISIIAWVWVNIYMLRKYNYIIPAIVFFWAAIGIIVAQTNAYIIGWSIAALIIIPISLVQNSYGKKS